MMEVFSGSTMKINAFLEGGLEYIDYMFFMDFLISFMIRYLNS